MASGDEPKSWLIVPSVSTAIRDTMSADVGTIIFNTTTSKLNFCKVDGVGAGNWEAVTSVQEV